MTGERDYSQMDAHEKHLLLRQLWPYVPVDLTPTLENLSTRIFGSDDADSMQVTLEFEDMMDAIESGENPQLTPELAAQLEQHRKFLEERDKVESDLMERLEATEHAVEMRSYSDLYLNWLPQIKGLVRTSNFTTSGKEVLPNMLDETFQRGINKSKDSEEIKTWNRILGLDDEIGDGIYDAGESLEQRERALYGLFFVPWHELRPIIDREYPGAIGEGFVLATSDNHRYKIVQLEAKWRREFLEKYGHEL